MVEKTLYEYEKKGKPESQKPEEDSENEKWDRDFCAVCGLKASHECVKCGKWVCSEHFVSLMGLCVQCAPVKKPKGEEKDEVVVVKGESTTVKRKESPKTSKQKTKTKANSRSREKNKGKDEEENKIEWV